MELETPIPARIVVEYDDMDATEASRSIANVSAYVAGVEAIALIQERARLTGVAVSDGDATGQHVLRLAMEEVAVGISHGVLTLTMDDQPRAGAIGDALRATVACETLSDRQELFAIRDLAALRVRVFAELWQRGHFVAFGSKFGVDFLVYEADPRTCHSFAMVVVKDYAASFTTVDIVSHCRVAKMVKKQFLLASEVDGQIVYLSLDHAVLAAARHEGR